MTVTVPEATFSPRPGLPGVERPRSRRFGRGLRTFIRRSPLSAFWGCIAAAIVCMSVFAPYLAPYEPLKSDFRRMSKPPDMHNYFGTDQIGRDTLSRVIHGSRASRRRARRVSTRQARARAGCPTA